nr:MAG TPA: hypothetical protein [Caudoviricetes sp.]
MTVPCGGTGVSREKRMQTSSQANMRAPIPGLFVFVRHGMFWRFLWPILIKFET